MRRAALPLLILATVLVAALFAWLALNHGHLRTPPRGAVASGEPVTDRRPLPPFTAIDVTGMAEITSKFSLRDGKLPHAEIMT